jgi:predicted  nucleic acid-binding Zn-ribbon protein
VEDVYERLDSAESGRRVLESMREVADLDQQVDRYSVERRRAQERLDAAQERLVAAREEFRERYREWLRETYQSEG